MGLDKRIGSRFLRPEIWWIMFKDTKAIISTGDKKQIYPKRKSNIFILLRYMKF